ncbi:hypothetical protein ONZ45_g9927 [Pleurotus djamor]|nr:hypothetical protein ONZ45_g9927 [Pleurotus djamor]
MKHILRAADSVGISQAVDINSPTAPATCYACLDTIIDSSSRRVSTRDAFLPKETVQGRPNLVICVETIVTRLKVDTIDGELRAIGVYYEDRGQSPRTFYIQTSKEIILCAGAVATPQLLMLSGIGPAAHLSEFGIKVVKDMPGVGSYLKDHANVIVTFEVPMEDSLHRIRNQPLHAIKEFVRYLISGSGSFGRAFLNWTIFIQTPNLNEDSVPVKNAPSKLDVTQPQNLPDIEIMPVPNRCTEDFTSPLDKVGCFTLMVCLVKPKSHGNVRLSSTDPHERATVDVAYLSDPDDYVPLRKGTRLALKLAERMEHQGYPLKLIYVPASTSDSDIDTFIHNCIRTSYHYTSTCRMAPEDDRQPGVVDDDLKVHGVQGLRICDTSVFPEIVTTHTMAPAVVVAEKCADLIKLNGA